MKHLSEEKLSAPSGMGRTTSGGGGSGGTVTAPTSFAAALLAEREQAERVAKLAAARERKEAEFSLDNLQFGDIVDVCDQSSSWASGIVRFVLKPRRCFVARMLMRAVSVSPNR